MICNVKTQILFSWLYTIRTAAVEEKLFKYQENSALIIMSSILITPLIDFAWIIQGEILLWSPLGLEGLASLNCRHCFLNGGCGESEADWRLQARGTGWHLGQTQLGRRLQSPSEGLDPAKRITPYAEERNRFREKSCESSARNLLQKRHR